jgi:hypothetical protein
MTATWAAGLVLALTFSQGAAVAPPPPEAHQAQAPSPSTRFSIDGHVALLADVLPRKDAAEARPQIVIDATGRAGRWFRYRLEALVEGLAARRGGAVTDGVARARDGWIELAGARADLRAGYGRLVWGRLDEIQPSDVINPLDTARFLLDGRSAARLPVTFVRGRVLPSERWTIEGVLVPVFRRGTFDELDEPTSPFNLVNDVVLPLTVTTSQDVEHLTPPTTWANVSGGGRLSSTIGRVDVAAAVYRGFDGFGLISFVPDFQTLSVPGSPAGGIEAAVGPAVVGHLVERFPRFTMVSGDFETVRGDWAIRGEVAAFVEKQFAGLTRPGPVDGHAIDGGVGVDRRSGDYRVFGSMLIHREWSSEDAGVARTDVSLVGSVDRMFGRDRYLVRAFGVLNPGDRSGFLRGLLVWTARDNFAVEASAGAFLGTGDDTLGRFKGRDFLFGRVRCSF